jgi:hypothetical protein
MHCGQAPVNGYIELIKDRIHAKDLLYIQRVANGIIGAFDDAIEAELRSKETYEGLTCYKYAKLCTDPNGIGKVLGYPPTTVAYASLHRDICERVKSHYVHAFSGAWFDVSWEVCALGAPYVLFKILAEWSGHPPNHPQDLETDVRAQFATAD